MATQLAETYEAPEPDKAAAAADNDQGGPVERDFDAEARAHGWVPKEEFKGDPTRWTDAETFVKKADEVMPLLRKKTQAQDREIADLKRQIARASEHFSKAEERAYTRALNDLKAQQEAAVEAGDLNAHREVSKKIDELRDEVEAKPKADVSPIDVKRALVDFRDANPWYDGETAADKRARDYADLLAEEHEEKAKAMPPAEFFSFIADKVKERYPALGKAADDQSRRRSAVEGAGNVGRPSRGGKSFNDLPVEAQRAADKWHKQGLFGDPSKVTLAEARKRYVETYPWDAKD